MAKFIAVVRKSRGPWQHRVQGSTAREVKRKLGKIIGLSVRDADALPLGKSAISVGEWSQVHIFEQVRRGWRHVGADRLQKMLDRV